MHEREKKTKVCQVCFSRRAKKPSNWIDGEGFTCSTIHFSINVKPINKDICVHCENILRRRVKQYMREFYLERYAK